MPRTFLRTIAFVSVLVTAVALAAEPVDLGDTRPRFVEVCFENTDGDPGALGREWGEPARAWLRPAPTPGRVEIRVAAEDMERVLAELSPVPGSFGDFVWLLERETGHVLSASLEGEIRQRAETLFFNLRVQTRLHFEMDTLRDAGYRAEKLRFGNRVFDYCDADDAGCNFVETQPYDTATGYVNAVGSVLADAGGGIRVKSFSPLGEARFREISAALSGSGGSASSGPRSGASNLD